MKKCCIENCDKPAKNGLMCWAHYTSKRRYGDALHTDKNASVRRRFDAGHKKTNDNECWNWIKNTHSSGLPYGTIYAYKKHFLAHRLSWILHNGPIEEGMFVLHKCDNARCVNPSHLYLGTSSDNAIDRETRKRRCVLKGEEIGNSKLIEEQVASIKKSSDSCYKLAKQYSVSPGLIHLIKTNRVWKHVEVCI